MSIPDAHRSDLTPIRAVILDYGDVISQPVDPTVISWMAALFRMPEERFRQVYGSLRYDYDRGAFKPEQYWTAIGQAAGLALEASTIVELRKADVGMWSRLNGSVLQWAHQLSELGMKTAVLSNMHVDMVEEVRTNATWARGFECLVLSSEIHLAKPDPEIFKHCLNCLRVEPGEALFVDDREPNILAAASLGIRGIVAASPVELRRNLQALGFEPLPHV